MKPQLSTTALAIILASAAGAAQAQTTVVTERPLQLSPPQQQTTVTRTVVERRVVRPKPAQRVIKARVDAPVAAPREVIRTTTTTTRTVVTPPPAAVTRTVVAPPPVVTSRTVVAPAAAPELVRRRAIVSEPQMVAEPLRLAPWQRASIYRAIVQTPVRPMHVVTRGLPPPAADDLDLEPAPVTTGSGYVERRVTIEPPAIAVGMSLPATVPLYAIPPSAMAAMPEIEGYRYAMVEERVMLVDPETYQVVATLSD